MAKYNVTLSVQYVVEAGSLAEAYHFSTAKLNRSQAMCETDDMATRYDGMHINRISPVPFDQGD